MSEYYKKYPYIHYSNCHEDADLLLSYVPKHTKQILSIASALDNSLALLVKEEHQVLAIDSNPTQIYLSKLKKVAVTYLTYEEFLIFIGLKEGNISSLYEKVRKHLDSETLAYFDAHLDLILKVKLIHCGRFESYFQLFKNKIFPLTTSKKNIKKFMEQATIEEQFKFYKRHIHTFRFRLLFKIFFSKRIMKKKGRDQAYFKFNKEPQAKCLKRRFELGLQHHLNQDNPYLNYVVLNTFHALPFYLKKENYEKIKQNIEHLEIRQMTLHDLLDEKKQFDFMNLSDVFEYMSEEDTRNHERKIVEHLNPKGRVVFWNMMNDRTFQTIKRVNDSSDLKLDRAFYYKDILVYEK